MATRESDSAQPGECPASRPRSPVDPLSLADAPARDVDWTKEARQRAEYSRFRLPLFARPIYEELRRPWKENSGCRRFEPEV